MAVPKFRVGTLAYIEGVDGRYTPCKVVDFTQEHFREWNTPLAVCQITVTRNGYWRGERVSRVLHRVIPRTCISFRRRTIRPFQWEV